MNNSDKVKVLENKAMGIGALCVVINSWIGKKKSGDRDIPFLTEVRDALQEYQKALQFSKTKYLSNKPLDN